MAVKPAEKKPPIEEIKPDAVKARVKAALARFHKSLAKLPETTSDKNPEAEGGRSA